MGDRVQVGLKLGTALIQEVRISRLDVFRVFACGHVVMYIFAFTYLYVQMQSHVSCVMCNGKYSCIVQCSKCSTWQIGKLLEDFFAFFRFIYTFQNGTK